MEWRCPTCQQPTDSAVNADFPFCSQRCRRLDLGHWADESYRISTPAPAAALENDSEPDDPHSA
jgi:hypothetical protein